MTRESFRPLLMPSESFSFLLVLLILRIVSVLLQSSKFCLAPSGMGFSTRTYESVAQGCVPLIIQDEPVRRTRRRPPPFRSPFTVGRTSLSWPFHSSERAVRSACMQVSNTTVDQAFDEILPWEKFSLRLWQKDIPDLPKLLAEFPDDKWRELRRNLACAWPRVLWLNADNEAPGMQTDDIGRADATTALGTQGYLSGYDAMESIMHTLARRRAKKKGLPPAPFEWRTPASSCKTVQGPAIMATPPTSAQR